MPLFLRQNGTEEAIRLYEADANLVVWWGTRTECFSALARWIRERHVALEETSSYRERLARLFRAVREVAPSDPVRETAERLLLAHPLRAADALQLAAAHIWAGDSRLGREFVSLDTRLREAALREGFAVLPASL